MRGKSGRVIGHLAGWLTTMKGLPSGYNKDLQEDKEAVFDAEDQVRGSLRATVAVVESMEARPRRSEGAAGGMLLATDVADWLVDRGVPFRRAHEIVGGIVRDLLAQGRDFESLTPEEWRGYDARFGAGGGARVTSRASVGARRTPQSTSPEAVASALAAVRAWVGEQGDR